LYSEPAKKWKQLTRDYSVQEQVRAEEILNSIFDLKDKSTRFKILTIGKLLYNRFHRFAGGHSPSLSVSPTREFEMLNASDSLRVWCGDFAGMFAFFCNALIYRPKNKALFFTNNMV
jgi:hypothetical protein